MYLGDVEEYKKYSQEEIEINPGIRFALERILYLITQASIDLGEILIAYKKLRKPGNQSEIFQILKEKNVITRHLEEKLIAMTGFRNVIAHDYAKIDYAKVYKVLHEGLKDIEEFIKMAGKIT